MQSNRPRVAKTSHIELSSSLGYNENPAAVFRVLADKIMAAVAEDFGDEDIDLGPLAKWTFQKEKSQDYTEITSAYSLRLEYPCK